MAAPVLTSFEKKRTLSGKKKNKKTFKNVLGLPSNLKVEKHSFAADEVKDLNEILERLLPSAKIPVSDSTTCKNEKGKNLTEKAKNKRSRLAIGVNEVNKNIKKELLSAVLLANDIYPQFLVQHLSLSCSHSKIPVIHVPDLREIIKNCLGFPAIAFGFKKNFSDFLEAVEEIKRLFEVKQLNLKKNTEEKVTQNGDEETSRDEETSSDQESCDENIKTEQNTFTYLYRNSTKTRVFIPEYYKDKDKDTTKKDNKEFIPLQKPNEEDEIHSQDLPEKGISMNLLNKKRKTKIIDLNNLEDSVADEEEELITSKKKKKKPWVIDVQGTRKKFKYTPPNLTKVSSNPDRFKKNNKHRS